MTHYTDRCAFFHSLMSDPSASRIDKKESLPSKDSLQPRNSLPISKAYTTYPITPAGVLVDPLVSSSVVYRDTLYIGTGGVGGYGGEGVFSYTDADGWNRVGSNIGNINALIVYNDFLYVGTVDGYVYRLINNIWYAVGNQLQTVTSFAIHNSVLYVGGTGIFRLENNIWTIPGGDNYGLGANDLCSFNNTLYAGYNGGAYSIDTTTGIHTDISFVDTLRDPTSYSYLMVSSFCVYRNELYISTVFDGVWKLQSNGTCSIVYSEGCYHLAEHMGDLYCSSTIVVKVVDNSGSVVQSNINYGTGSGYPSIFTLLDMSGVLYAGTNSVGVYAYTNSAWGRVGVNGPYNVTYICTDDNDIGYVVGQFGVFEISNNTYTQIGNAFNSGSVVSYNGEIYIGNAYGPGGGGGVKVLRGGVWAPLGMYEVYSMKVCNDTLYIGGINTETWCICSIQGTASVQVELELPNYECVTGFALSNGNVYAGSWDSAYGDVGNLYILNNGSWDTIGTLSKITTLCDYSGTLYIGCTTGLFTLSGSDILPVSSLAGSDITSMIVLNGVLYAGSRDGHIYALSGANIQKYGTIMTDVVSLDQ